MGTVRRRVSVSDRLWAAALLYPAPLYAALLVLLGPPGGGVGMLVGFLLPLGFGTATGVGLVRPPTWVWTGRLLLALLVLVPFVALPLGNGVGYDLAAGVVIGSPFLWLEYAWSGGSSPLRRVVALQATFLVGIVCLAASATEPSIVGRSGGSRFFGALGQVLLSQLGGIGNVYNSGVGAGLPLESTFDAVYAALGGVALLGVVLSWMYPHTARDEALPWSWVPRRAPAGPLRPAEEELGLRPGQREALATRTRPLAPDTVLPPGFLSLVVAVLLLVGFVALADGAPSFALLVLVLGCVAAATAVSFVLGRHLTALGGLEG